MAHRGHGRDAENTHQKPTLQNRTRQAFAGLSHAGATAGLAYLRVLSAEETVRARLADSSVAASNGRAAFLAPLIGTVTTDPAFGLPATWIEERQRESAQMAGFTVVDCSTVVATHLSHLMQVHAAKLLGRVEDPAPLDVVDLFERNLDPLAVGPGAGHAPHRRPARPRPPGPGGSGRSAAAG